MLKMVIELNEDNIIKEDKYYLSDVLSYIDSYFEKKNIEKIEKGIYQAADEKLIQFLGIITRLSRNDVFVRYVKKWLWYGSEEEILHDDPENLIEAFEIKVS